MNKNAFMRRSVTGLLALSMWIVPVAAIAQRTQIVAPKNKYKVQDDIKLGADASAQVERQFPIINDADATAYIQRVGQRLVSAIPAEFRQPAFNYRFRWVNVSDLNAFALPGGPMYVNRGMIEMARNEGEMAGVMAHEISHVALRHATAQATKQSSAKNTLGAIGLILGGAIVGGQTGAQLGGLFAQSWMLKYSREYETQADTLGARIMADAGYDPRDLANVFKTIQEQSKGGGPEWLSSHPDPGNRYEKINREAQYLNVSANPIKVTRDFERIQARFRAMPKARSMSEIERSGGSGGGPVENPTSNGRYSDRVAAPSTRMRAYTGLNWLRLNVPSNWLDFASQDDVQFAPEGAYGNQGITRGMMIGIGRTQDNDLERATSDYLNGILQANSYLQQRGGLIETYVANRRGYTTVLSGRSPVTNRTENVTIYTVGLRNGQLFYFITVVPNDESYAYNATFRNILNSVRLND
jgi:predicted Zn-dependent protease